MTENMELRVSYQPQAHVEWKIKQFFELPIEEDHSLRSPSFSLRGSQWFLLIYTNGRGVNLSPGWIGLFLINEVSTDQRFSYRFGIEKNDRLELKSIESEDTFEMKKRWGLFKFIERVELLTSQGVLDPVGTLTVFCTVRIMGGALAWSTIEAASQTPLNAIPTLLQNFKDLYLSKCYADVRIAVKGKEFLAHKIVLTSRSTVFSSMFNSDMAEKNSGKVEITDYDPETFEEFLLFLYTGMLDTITSSNAGSLYETADKYDVQELKAACVRCMITELTVESFCNVIRLATIHDETELLQVATVFFIENAKNILATINWQNFSTEYPSIGNVLFLKFVHKYT